jgi:hypothetical protein
MKTEFIQEVFEKFQRETGRGLLASDIFNRKTSESIVGYNTQPSACELFTKMSDFLDSALKESGFPSINRYYLVDLTGDKVVILVYLHPEYLWGMLCSTDKIRIGMILNVIIPKYRKEFKQAL